MEKRGEITVFLSLILVCTISLLLGILESARTAGSRLYLRMAADSAMDSLMSQYNRNLWEMYRLLFLEYETEDAVRYSYESYLDYYMNQKNFYPMRRRQSEITDVVLMEENGAEALEEEILDYIKYRLPDVAANLSGIAQIPEETARAGDFRELLNICRRAGKKTRKLEKARKKVEDLLKKMQKTYELAYEAASDHREGRFRSETETLMRQIKTFPGYVDGYEKEEKALQMYLEELKTQNSVEDTEAAAAMSQEIMAYEGAAEEAGQCLLMYKEMEKTLEENQAFLNEALELLDEPERVSEGNGEDDEEEEAEPDWEAVLSSLENVKIPVSPYIGERDSEKAAAVDRLEELLDQDLLSLVLPEGTVISNRQASGKGIPSSRFNTGDSDTGNPLRTLLINEYVFLYFDSFMEKSREAGLPEVRTLAYEQEYMLGGKTTDRENLKTVAERLLAVRGALNLLYLLSSPEKKSSADALAAAISAGSAPVQVVLSFFILSLWAFGESVSDLRILFSGGKVPVWKSEMSWKLELDELLSLEFLKSDAEKGGQGYDYEDYMRVLFLMQDRQQKNFRMMDLIEWNVRTRQKDFSIASCAREFEIKTEVLQRHMFFQKEEYETSLFTRRTY